MGDGVTAGVSDRTCVAVVSVAVSFAPRLNVGVETRAMRVGFAEALVIGAGWSGLEIKTRASTVEVIANASVPIRTGRANFITEALYGAKRKRQIYLFMEN